MKGFHYHNTEKKMHKGRHVVRRVWVKGKKGFKSVTTHHSRKRKTVKRPLSCSEVRSIKNGRFVPGLFKDCYTK